MENERTKPLRKTPEDFSAKASLLFLSKVRGAWKTEYEFAFRYKSFTNLKTETRNSVRLKLVCSTVLTCQPHLLNE
jgi:hypothetical protein